MATQHGSSCLSRTRSTRTPANTGKAVLTPSRATSTSTVSVSTIALSNSSFAATTPSNISLFLTTLRLLDLDQHPDWPNINALTFSAKDAAQGQKKRIQCVEWALYYLFTLWDHEKARNKLRPFFPPLDQVQSLNLRAALLRGLEQAKKNGVLGRDAVVRKTMLDECKGERLAEVLAVFSSAVLKKLVAEQQLNDPSHPALAQTLALEHRGYTGERTELNCLILAHKVSLHGFLKLKNAARARYKDFSDLLRLKEQTIARRREQIEAARESKEAGKDISEDLKLDLWRTVRNNWSGNERWMEALLYGDSHGKKDGLLSAPFDRVWRRVQSGRLSELEDKSGGLLEQLDSRVQSQRSRLERWQSFRQEMFGEVSLDLANKNAKSRPREKGIDLGFRAHENLHLGRLSPKKLVRTKPSELYGEYEEVVHGLEAQLATLSQNKAQAQIPSFFQKPRDREPVNYHAPATSPEPEVISEISDIEDDLQPASIPQPEPVKVVEPAFEPPLRRTKTFKERRYPREEEPITASELRRSATIQARNSTRSARRPAYESPIRSPERRPSPSSPVSPSPSHRTPPPPIQRAFPDRINHSPEQSLSSPTQQLADQILASVNAASPSPVKKPRHTLSLAERTRLSMPARRTSLVVLKVEDEDEVETELDRLPIRRPPPRISVDPAVPQSPERHSPTRRPRNGSVVETIDENHQHHYQTPDLTLDPELEPEYEDLVSRTRRSMAGFEAARQKAQLERRRSQRKSKHLGGGRNIYFPPGQVNEEDDDVEGAGVGMDSTLLIAEELMSGEGQNDYDAVFMSRPKIKTSPVGTPTKFNIGLWDD